MSPFFSLFGRFNLAFASRGAQAAHLPKRMQPHQQSDTNTQASMKRKASREKLNQTVRDAMNRAGILSSTYKFKVLTIEGDRTSFQVLVDISAMAIGQGTKSLQDMEALIIQGAKFQHSIKVSSVFWRCIDLAQIKPPMPAQWAAEVLAKRKRLVEAVAQQSPMNGTAMPSPHKPPIRAPKNNWGLRQGDRHVEDFGDTLELNQRPRQALSTTQYGDL